MTEDQIIAQEIAKLQSLNAGHGEQVQVNEKSFYEDLAADFGPEACTKDSSRGFDLTSVKAQYVVERLNEVVGVMNWSFGGEYEKTDDGVLFMGALIINVNGKSNRHFAPGFSKNKKNIGDTYKSANTDSLSKCASKFGIANAVFKGLVDPKSGVTSNPTARASKAAVGKTLTTKKVATKKAVAKKEEAPTETPAAEEKKPSSFNRRRSNPRTIK